MADKLLERARIRLNAYYDAELKVLEGQSYQLNGKTLTRANLSEIRSAIKELENLVAKLQAQTSGKARRKAFRIVPRDL